MSARPDRRQVGGLAATAALLALAACGHRTGRMDATWSGADKGRMSGQAGALWCRASRVAVVTGVSGDTGVSLLIHPADGSDGDALVDPLTVSIPS